MQYCASGPRNTGNGSGDHYARLPSNNLSQTAFELWMPKENSRRQQLSGAPHATQAKSVDKHVRRELDCTPSLVRINIDYDTGSVVSTAQSNNMYHIILHKNGYLFTNYKTAADVTIDVSNIPFEKLLPVLSIRLSCCRTCATVTG